MALREYIKNNILVFDGAMGTMLQKSGLKLGENPEQFNFIHEEELIKIHKKYIESGAKVITTNTFGANELKLKDKSISVEEAIEQGINLAKKAREDKECFIALDIGPIGELLEPMGTLSFERAVEIFKRQIKVGAKFGVDLILIETMTDLYEMKAAIIAAKENCDLPIFATMSFEENGRTFTGCLPESMAVTLEGLGVDVLGVNCSLGPKELKPIIKRIIKNTNLPIMVQPNAGLPKIINGETLYKISPEEFCSYVEELVDLGVSVIGGCCGTTPEFIKSISNMALNKTIVNRIPICKSMVSTPSKVVEIDEVRIIGERINPTGKKEFKEAILKKDIDYILRQAIEQIEVGADILDINVGLPQINEANMIETTIKEIQSIVDTPLQIDSGNIEAIERALRIYNGKPIVNSVNGEDKSLESILPLVKKYGAAVVGLTLDSNGVPKSCDERVEIAKKIVKKALEIGIKKEDIYIDCLTLTVSAQQEEVMETLKALKIVKEKLGVKTVLGVSNISFGLPNRELINETFLALALGAGLDLPIINPNKEGMLNIINAFKLLNNNDKNAKKYIETYKDKEIENHVLSKKVESKNSLKKDEDITLEDAILQGLKSNTRNLTKELLKAKSELEIVDEFLIPALDKVGEKYEKEEIFLPQLIQSAETVKEAFALIKDSLSKNNREKISKGKIILATVKGDIHDIGKNIVKVVLENYGYDILDLGKDVPIEKVVKEALDNNIELVGLSALMTTTIKSMEDTIIALKKADFKGKIMVGGAVVTEDYANKIGADFYAKDAKDSVEIAKVIFN
ncbi:homocysteine S-methyltransferase family protein [Clostridium fallax]|uniref:Methionine synthase n=1 Tax=Clostridium fallax TaxID=1533 RepID=A0A1M4YLS0_9CLOT|nr:homocysteine S-methyltransferase family protein [Clostridium fallax]SHF06577.1 5-methyltetrahydrofolate--homocysteine methyltransferase [Clostridium fallax]SQB06453.1 5-methyltetrahydrofolate--homocysteine methyltransferase [Clostridium fallax]